MGDKNNKDLSVSENKQALEELEKAHPEIKNMKPDEKMAMLKVFQSFSGPLPPPSYMAGYGNVDKSFPERIMRMAEKEQEHRHKLNRSLLLITRLAQILTAFLVAFVSWIGYKSIVLGYTRCAVIIFGITIGALLTAYLGANKGNTNKQE